MTPQTALARAVVALSFLGCSIEQTGGAPGETGGSGGSVLGGFGGDGAGGGAGGAAGTAPAGCSAGFQCVPQAPPQWGYAFLALAPFSAGQPTGPSCPDGADPQAFFTEPAGAGTCTACSCGPLQGGACSVPLVCGYNSTCASFQDFTQNDGDCQMKSGSPTLSCLLGGPTVTAAGTCAASGGAPAPMDPWKKRADFCPAKGASACGAGSECVPLGSDVYAASVCVYLPGDHACPSDWPTRTVIFQKHLDERKCSPCTCTQGTVTCLAEYEFYDDGICSGSGKKVATTSCTDVSGHINDFWLGWSYKRTKSPVLGGTCAPSGGAASGEIGGDPNSAITVCCRPAS